MLTKFHENRLGIDRVINEKPSVILDHSHLWKNYTLGSSGSYHVVAASRAYIYVYEMSPMSASYKLRK